MTTPITIALPAEFTTSEARETIVAVLREQARLDLITRRPGAHAEALVQAAINAVADLRLLAREAHESDPRTLTLVQAADRLATALLPFAT